MLTEVQVATYLCAAGTEREGEMWHKEEQVLLQEGGGQMPCLTLQGEVANYLQNNMFSGLICTFKLFPSRHWAATFRRFSQHQWSGGRCGFPVAVFSFLPRGSEGLANHLSAPVGRVDSASTTGPVFKSDESKADLATLKAGGLEEWRQGGQKEGKEWYCCTDLSLSLSFQAVNVAFSVWGFMSLWGHY